METRKRKGRKEGERKNKIGKKREQGIGKERAADKETVNVAILYTRYGNLLRYSVP